MATLEAIYVSPVKRQPTTFVDAIDVTAVGLVGDRYALGVGSFSKAMEDADAGRHVTLIAAEAIEQALAGGDDFRDGRHRRNLVVRGLGPLAELIYGRLRVGPACVLRVDRTCPPCGHLGRLTATSPMRSLLRRGGLRLTVLEPGPIRVGDRVEVLPRR